VPEWARQFPIENILLDLLLVSAALWLPPANVFWTQHLTEALWIAAPLQVIALFCAFYGGRRTSGGRTLPAWFLSIYFLNAILAVGGFIWLFLIASAIEKQTGGFPNGGVRFAFLTAVFGGLSAFGAAASRTASGEVSVARRHLLALGVFMYLRFTESVLGVSVGIANPGAATVVGATIISYLPVRLVLAFQPPFSYWDLASAIVCFGVYVYSLM